MKMSIKPKNQSSIVLPEELPDEIGTSTLSFFENSVFNAAHNKLKEHLDNKQVQHTMLNSCLMTALQIVQRNDREMAQVAPTLQLLLQHGAQWKDDALLEHQMTPYHLICKSTGDHHELLDLMMKMSGETVIVLDKVDDHHFTALLYAVQNANLNCVRNLITYGADVNKNVISGRGVLNRPLGFCEPCTPLLMALDLLLHNPTQPPISMTGILDLLLESGADVNIPNSEYRPLSAIRVAISAGNADIVVKMIKNGAQLNACNHGHYAVWVDAAKMGSVEVVKCMLEHGLDKDSTDQVWGDCFLSWVVAGHNIEAARYLLDLGVTIPKLASPCSEFKLCQGCGTSKLFILDSEQKTHQCLKALQYNEPKMVELLEEYDSSSSCIPKYFETLRRAVYSSSVDSVEYLLSRYTYSINVEYTDGRTCENLLSECYYSGDSAKIIKLLLDHGADPNKKICNGKIDTALTLAIRFHRLDIVALYIRNGVDINFRAHLYDYGDVTPFQLSVQRHCPFMTEMFLVSGCSCRVYSLDNNLKTEIISAFEDLMEKWNVHENNVQLLQQLCRRLILNHLCPQAEKKIVKLPLPPCLISYLHIPELDDILNARQQRQ